MSRQPSRQPPDPRRPRLGLDWESDTRGGTCRDETGACSCATRSRAGVSGGSADGRLHCPYTAIGDGVTIEHAGWTTSIVMSVRRSPSSTTARGEPDRKKNVTIAAARPAKASASWSRQRLHSDSLARCALAVRSAARVTKKRVERPHERGRPGASRSEKSSSTPLSRPDAADVNDQRLVARAIANRRRRHY